MLELIKVFRWQDVVDILAVAFLIYRVLVFIRRTRALQMLIGLALLILAFFLSEKLDFFTLRWILNSFLSSIIIVIFILFQSEIRRGLTQVGKGTFFWDVQEQLQLVEEISRAAIQMASKKAGGLIVIERSTGLKDYAENGVQIDAAVHRDLLSSIFNTESRLHDGAVIIRNGRITSAACFLPLTANPSVSRYFGSRHRAAMGITEETDAVAVLISEEEGQVSIVVDGKISPRMDRAALQGTLRDLITGREGRKRKTKDR
ncbi:MAG: TIGR00159 family protein [Deltaproteobacteria bacterium]|nr:TIGR00159 family protein [Deltaproteobacteria bacterium]